MQPGSDPLIRNEQRNSHRSIKGKIAGGYQAIESASHSGGSVTNGPTATSLESLRILYSQAKEAKENSQGCCSFFLTFIGLLIGSLVWTLILVITLTIPIVMIILGATYIHDCKVQWMIPIFNIVGGSVLTISNAMNMIVRFRRWPEREVSRTVNVVGWITTFLNVFLIGWFVAGCYWVFSVPQARHDNNLCESTLYSFTFWLLNAVFIFFGTMVVASLVMACFILLCF